MYTAHQIYRNDKVIPRYRIVGFPEHTYTRTLSMVGELMGAAEFAFVTIHQRLLADPLAVRAHYGHPDFVDGYWTRTRGCQSKASEKINVNEDIFSAYEVFCRGEQIGYVEYIEEQKGRETAFSAATTFESKLAMGAAQQLRSREIYQLNQSLPFIRRLSLFMGSIAFYAINLLMSTSIAYYLYGITLFAIAQVSYHQMGLLGAVISVPWLFQIGFVQAFPLLIELILERGWVDGIIYFVKYLPFSLVFFVFHLRTKAYFFACGILKGQGGYRGTGRGFGLDRTNLKDLFMSFAASHFYEALKLLLALIIYGLVTTDGFWTGM
mgnify:FL=1